MTTWQVVLFVLFVVSVLTYLAAKVIERLQERWAILPDFVWNAVGGINAYCSVSDFTRTARTYGGGTRTYGFVIVPDTLAFNKVSGRWCPVLGRWWLDIREPYPLHFSRSRHEASLFVPFVSERYLKYDQQAKVFCPPPPPHDLSAFVESKKEANCQHDFRRRFAAFVTRNESKFFGVRVMSLVMVIGFSVGLGVSAISQAMQSERAAPAVLYTTTLGSSDLTELRGTRTEIGKLPVNENVIGRVGISAGPVVDIMPLGGGISYVCVLCVSDGFRLCGFASSTLGLKEGDTTYLRFGSGVVWTGGPAGNSDIGSVRWAVSEQEAIALRDKAGYRFKQ